MIKILSCCNASVKTHEPSAGKPQHCLYCNNYYQISYLPQQFHQSQAKQLQTISAEASIPCYYDEKLTAKYTCQACGVHMSEAWSATWGNQIICLKCLEHQLQNPESSHFVQSLTRYDRIALIYALLPIIIFPFIIFSILIAPCVLFTYFKYRKTTTSLVANTKRNWIIAFTLATLQIMGWLVVILNFYLEAIKK
jgi:hypothetical protein